MPLPTLPTSPPRRALLRRSAPALALPCLLALLHSPAGAQPRADETLVRSMDQYEFTMRAQLQSLLPPGNAYKVVSMVSGSRVGTLFVRNSTLPLDRRACLPPADAPKDPLPNLYRSLSVTRDVGAELTAEPGLRRLLSGNVKHDDKESLVFSVRGVQLQAMSLNDLDAVLARPECRAAMRGQTVWLLLGLVHGKRSIKLTNTDQTSAGLNIAGMVRVGGSAGAGTTTVEWTDENEVPFLQIVSEVNPGLLDAEGRPRLMAPAELRPLPMAPPPPRPSSSGAAKPTPEELLRLEPPGAGPAPAPVPAAAGSVVLVGGPGFADERRTQELMADLQRAGDLSTAAFAAPVVVDAADERPAVAELRYFRDADLARATQLLQGLRLRHPEARLVRVRLPSRSERYELWLPGRG